MQTTYKFKTLLKREVVDVVTLARLLPPVAVELSSRFLHDVEAALLLQTPANIQVSDYQNLCSRCHGNGLML
jgi:hypothetical protein